MASKVHSGDCGACSLCHKSSTRYTHAMNMDERLYNFLCDVEGTTVQKEACICHACYKQVSRNVGNPSYHPRWRPKPKVKAVCSVEKCSSESYRSTTLSSPTEIATLLDVRLTSFTVDVDGNKIPLCRSHYNHLCSILREPPKCCESCGTKPKGKTQFIRHCSAPDVINAYISMLCDEQAKLNNTSIICGACYNFFNRIIKQMQQAQQVFSLIAQEDGPGVQQTPAAGGFNLDSVETELTNTMCTIRAKGNDISTCEYLELIACSIGQVVLTAMQQNEVLLLPDLYRQFCDSALKQTARYPTIGFSQNDIPSTRWLLSKLHTYFEDNIVFNCKQKKVGTMVLYRHCDILVVLSNNIGKGLIAQRHTMTSVENITTQYEQELAIHKQTIIQQSHDVAKYLNSKLHNQAKKFIADFNKHPEKCTTLDLSSLLDSTDECLLNFIQQVTMPIRDGRRNLFGRHGGIPVTQENKMRHLYILCLLLFNTNSSCYMPVHFLLTEAILCHGGSMELIKLFNRFGMVSSLDTNNRIATYIVQKRIIEGIKPSMEFGMLTVVSIDNVDILQPNAVVSALDATRSWHGTSVQCIQPQPKSDKLTPLEIVATSHSQPDDSQSPIPVQRIKRRRRTIAEACSPHTHMITPRHERTEDTYKAICNELDIQELSCTSLSLDNFLLTATELTHFNQLKRDIHKCMLLKYFRQSDDDQTLGKYPSPKLLD